MTVANGVGQEPGSKSRQSVRVGVVGLGRLGRRHAQNLAYRVPGATLVAACSPLDEERAWARDTLPDLRLYDDYAALLVDSTVDAVWLVTPSALHAQQIVDALHAGKHVFCEKPLSLDVAECERVLAEAARYPHLQATIGFMRRFDPSYRDAFDKVRDGAIGRPFLVRSQTCDWNDPDGFFVRFAPTSGGIFLDCTVHDIDVARWLLGKPRAKRVFASGTVALHEGLREFGDVDNGVAICEFEDGRLAVFYASRTMAHGNDSGSEVIGTAGALSIGRNPRLNRVEILDAHGVRNECTPTFFERFEDAFLAEAQAFVAAVRGGAQTGASLADALEATRIGSALRASLASGEAVTL
ncbi:MULTISPECIES: Gfo/Idh/MocA family oxidoreductase [Paraburkholderia]|uniref:Gfo/Idh/MocA family oxidoreductase n=1 Tax=Paraburkholderia TaxID=1822464 RepID=UPI0022599FB2|nr:MULTISPECIES: Gfo/Idh/MocA family oxidoreductase [Paraburkholderia]MCX4165890.1 Gfo/Idh/MocA family oxidoreductase [Paraburkholderia megapolitana]MDN7161381.1 Gfo/Idh/MocA family oxidoreductase [Paraburkholderia sp. CHISQ3]MDQ6498428.1 Gfo/Idh/MocA family oxidoreductase [Paraburkholderia megapolitana]